VLAYDIGPVAEPTTDHLAKMFLVHIACIHIYHVRPQSIDQGGEDHRFQFVQGHLRPSSIYLIMVHDLEFHSAAFIDLRGQFFPPSGR
jgi:hypothetical protein